MIILVKKIQLLDNKQFNLQVGLGFHALQEILNCNIFKLIIPLIEIVNKYPVKP